MKKIKNISINIKEQTQSYATLMIEFIKILLACLLFIFISQTCPGPDSDATYIINKYNIDSNNLTFIHTCTIYDNFNFTTFDKLDYAVFCVNFLTLGVFVLNLINELRREKFIITHFDYDKNKSISDIKKVFRKDKLLHTKYINITKNLLYLTYACIYMLIFNVIISSYCIYKYYYDGFRTVTGLITNTILIVQKLYKNRSILTSAIKKEYVQSTILLNAFFYNDFDKIKFKIETEEINNNVLETIV